MVISTQASIRTNSLLIARFCNPPQNVLNVGAFESLPDDVFDSWLKIRCELLLIEERLVVTAARLLYEMSDDRAFRWLRGVNDSGPEIESDFGKLFDLLMERTHISNRWINGAVCIVDESFDWLRSW
jgi:hypothetical protein